MKYVCINAHSKNALVGFNGFVYLFTFCAPTKSRIAIIRETAGLKMSIDRKKACLVPKIHILFKSFNSRVTKTTHVECAHVKL